MNPIIIIGSGLAGYTLARNLRKIDAGVPLLMITQDDGHFYSKPMLSNAFAQNKTAAQLVTTAAEVISEQLNMTLLAHTQVTEVDCQAKLVKTNKGEFSYRQLVLAIGADPIRLPLQGNAAEDVLSVNDLQDYAKFRKALEGVKQVAIIGAGLIGCEFANDMVSQGITPIVFDPAAYPMSSLLPELAAKDMIAPLQQVGVQWQFGKGVVAVNRVDDGYQLMLSNGEQVVVGLVLSAVGLRPRTTLAKTMGLVVNRGIVVNALAQTSDINIYALGDCAEYTQGVLPYVMPIMNVAKALAVTLTGQPQPYDFPPMPVSVKTPACPVAVQPVAKDRVGRWESHAAEEGGGVKLTFKENDDRITGFVLTGKRVAERMAMTKLLS